MRCLNCHFCIIGDSFLRSAFFKRVRIWFSCISRILSSSEKWINLLFVKMKLYVSKYSSSSGFYKIAVISLLTLRGIDFPKRKLALVIFSITFLWSPKHSIFINFSENFNVQNIFIPIFMINSSNFFWLRLFLFKINSTMDFWIFEKSSF